jgi:hypothetical protein
MDEPLGIRSTPVSRERVMRQPRILTRVGSALDLWVAGLLTFVQLVFGVALTFLALLNQFAFDACSNPLLQCNFALGQVAFLIVPIAALLIFPLTVALIVLRHRRGRLSWWIPVVGACGTVIALLVSTVLTSIAVGRPPW